MCYGNHPYYDVTDLPFAEFPTTYEEAVQHLDCTNWALVNNPNPTERLHLREKPDRKSVSLGKFYNRTPVYVDEIRGEWAHVTIGCDLSGWMLMDYLAFGADMDKVACAFPQLIVKDEHQDVWGGRDLSTNTACSMRRTCRRTRCAGTAWKATTSSACQGSFTSS